jgi:hypothetical protein
MKSNTVKNLLQEIHQIYIETRDSRLIKIKVQNAIGHIELTGEELDEEDRVALEYQTMRYQYYMDGISVPIDRLDHWVRVGHLNAISYRLGSAGIHPLSMDLIEVIKSHLSKIFQSNDKNLISSFANDVSNSYNSGNPMGLTYEEVYPYEYIEDVNETCFIVIGSVTFHAEELSIPEWKKLVTTLLDIYQKVATNEKISCFFYPIRENMFVSLSQRGKGYKAQTSLNIVHREHLIFQMDIDFDSSSFKELGEVIKSIHEYFLCSENSDKAQPHTFISQVTAINKNVDWLNLPKFTSEAKYVLYGIE